MLRTRLLVVALLVVFGIPQEPAAYRRGSRAEIIIEWNQLLQATLPGDAAIRGTRYYSMMHIAMFDAVNAIDQEFKSYRVRPRHWWGGSAEAAAAQAAHDVLTALIGPRQAYEDALTERLGSDPSHFVTRGAELGARVAEEILAWRSNDGWALPVPPPPTYVNPPFPGLWQPTPPNNPVATFTHLQSATPMALLTTTQFLPPPPPPLASARYATDFNEVKTIGKSDSSLRDPTQSQTAQLWAGVASVTTTNLFAVWNNIAIDVVEDRHLSLVEAARLFVLLNVSMHDSVMTTQVSKFIYGLWRPVTAIRQAADDLNAGTDPDPTWLSFITNPPYPAYGGNMAAVGAGAATALALALGRNDIEVSARWQTPSTPIVHTFPGFWEVAEEQAMSRIWAGIHYRFDQEAGQDVGRKVGAFVFANYMQSRNHWGDRDE